ncbi:MAG: RNA-binding S4 domain-containing protein [Bacteroidales bacterium]|nr:RNA-binding S4 domain-containing protein [Bacteroidales bacterium]
MEEETTRIDKWLWSVRAFKTRSQATDACKSGKIKIDGHAVKPSRDVKIGETVRISKNKFTKSLKVTGILSNRVSAKIAVDYAEDVTPQAEYEQAKKISETNSEFRKKGLGRPTKKERRMIDYLKRGKG